MGVYSCLYSCDHLQLITKMSRYPSAYGQTPGYKSMTSSTSSYPSALEGSRRMDMDLGLSVGGRTSSSLLGSNIDREFASLSVTSIFTFIFMKIGLFFSPVSLPTPC